MIGNNIEWISSSSKGYVSVKIEDENKVSFYFTKNFFTNLIEKHPNFFDKEKNRYNLMIGFDKAEEKLLFGIAKESNKYTSSFTLTQNGNTFDGKPKMITDESLKGFIEKSSDDNKFKLVEYDSELKDDKLIINLYLDNVVYY